MSRFFRCFRTPAAEPSSNEVELQDDSSGVELDEGAKQARVKSLVKMIHAKTAIWKFDDANEAATAALALSQHAETNEMKERYADVLFAYAQSLMRQRKFPEAGERYQQCQAVFEELFGADLGKITNKIHHNRAEAYENAGDIERAETVLMEAIATYRQMVDAGTWTAEGSQDGILSELADSLVVASSLIKSSKSDKSAEFLEEAATLFKKLYGWESAKHAACIMNKGVMLQGMNMNTQGLEQLVMSARVYAKQLGGSSSSFALALYNTAMVLGKLSRLAESAVLFRESSNLWSKVSRAYHRPGSHQLVHTK